ncbi:MAG: Eco57I restriction-modification methylase domain-containing protein [Candidatus Latescibacteria bacterium]|nr:Eco57I restriction-modification methylase domain-containing protein [Candidatus Latescibacterota bacterium]
MMGNLLVATERARKTVNGATCRNNRAEIGQFLTPATTARFMASLFEKNVEHVRILDAGAGIGVLFAACVQAFCSRKYKPKSIEVVAIENDRNVLSHLNDTIKFCQVICLQAGVNFDGIVKEEDFVSFAIKQLDRGLFAYNTEKIRFTHAILNPPYKKINGHSKTRKMLDSSGYGTSNLYTAFVWLAFKMLVLGGELVAITPRSFCNGPYFKNFRKDLLESTSLQSIHVFESRNKAFSEDSVLQENVIYRVIRNASKPETVTISSTVGIDFTDVKRIAVPYDNVVLRGDPDNFIHLIQSEKGLLVMKQMKRFTCRLETLRLDVSTGRVVDFRTRDFIRQDSGSDTVPLIYPCHLENGFVEWPNVEGKKPNAILACDKTAHLLLPSGYYVLIKRFTAKEERRRVVASIFDPQRVKTKLVGFENHINYFHIKGKGLSANMAKGLALFLNSTIFDDYFRLFSGHTQVNATDLRKMRYPSRPELLRLGAHVKTNMPEQDVIDEILAKELGSYE